MLPLLAIGMLSNGCKKDDNTTSPNTTNSKYIDYGSAYAVGAGVKVQLMAKDSLFVGYNHLYLKLTDSADGSALDQASISLMPKMEMPSMTHSAPMENPGNQPDSSGMFEGAVVFLMPGDDMNHWYLDVNITNTVTGKKGMAEIPVTVITPPTTMMKSFTADNDSSGLFISLVKPKNPVVGANDFEIVLNKEAGMMNFPPVTGYSISITPEMPSMGHGSSNNVDPIDVGNGHYKGKVNFSMSGMWRVHLKIEQGSDMVAQDEYFDITCN